MKDLIALCALGLASFSGPIFGQVTVIDNSSPAGFAIHSGFIDSNNGNWSYNKNAVNSVDINSTDGLASWEFTGLDVTKEYDVAVTWNHVYPAGNLAGDAEYTLIGASTVTTQIIHNVLPVADLTHDDDFSVTFNFQILGRLKPSSGGVITLELRDDDGNGLFGVVADAAMVGEVSEVVAVELLITAVSLETLENRIDLSLAGLTPGETYHVEAGRSLQDFAPVAGAEFVATGVTEDIDVSADEETDPEFFLRIVEGAIPPPG